jgi:hypothetical protein
MNFAGAATAVSIGAQNAATLTLSPGTVVGSNTTQNLFNTVATTMNFAGAATTLTIGNSGTTVNLNGTITTPSISSSIATPSTTFNLINSTATTVNFAGAATGLTIGATTGLTTIRTTATSFPNSTSVLIGSQANNTRFPNALVVISTTTPGIQQNETHNIGIMAEGTANPLNTSTFGIGVYGVGYTSSATRSGGVVGEAHVSATGDTGSAIGVRGYSNDVHAGGFNIGLYGDATNGSSNYALYLNQGGIYNNYALTWTMNGNLTFSGAYAMTLSGDLLGTTTQNVFTASTTLNVGSAATAIRIGAATGITTITNSLTVVGGVNLGYASYTTSSAIANNVSLVGIRAVAPISMTLPAVYTGKTLNIKDELGNAVTYPITITPASGTIDGTSSFTISANYGTIALYSNGTNWFII